MRLHTSVLALVATAAVAWGALPAPPAAYSVRDVAQLSMVIRLGGRSKSMSKRIATNGRVELPSEGTLRIASPRGFFLDSEATCAPSGRSSMRFTFTPEARGDVLDQFEDAPGLAGLTTTARGRFSPGRLVFSRGTRLVRGHQTTRVTLGGNYAGRHFNVWVTVHTTWRGSRVAE